MLLRDDKSFPYILVTGDHDWPQISSIAGRARARATISAPSPRPARSSRPCRRCSAPSCCAPAPIRVRQPHPALPALPDQALQRALRRADRADDYPPGGGGARLPVRPQPASPARAGGADGGGRRRAGLREAAVCRDRIRALAHVQAHQDINPSRLEDADVVALHQAGGDAGIQVFFFRAGRTTATGPISRPPGTRRPTR